MVTHDSGERLLFGWIKSEPSPRAYEFRPRSVHDADLRDLVAQSGERSAGVGLLGWRTSNGLSCRGKASRHDKPTAWSILRWGFRRCGGWSKSGPSPERSSHHAANVVAVTDRGTAHHLSISEHGCGDGFRQIGRQFRPCSYDNGLPAAGEGVSPTLKLRMQPYPKVGGSTFLGVFRKRASSGIARPFYSVRIFAIPGVGRAFPRCSWKGCPALLDAPFYSVRIFPNSGEKAVGLTDAPPT